MRVNNLPKVERPRDSTQRSYESPAVAAGRGKGGEGGMRPGRHYAGGGGIWRAKIWNSKFGRFWRIGVCIAERIRREFALCNYTPNLLFVTVRINAIVVTIRISIADLTGGAATQTFAPGGKHPRETNALR